MSENQVVKAESKAITPMDMLHMAVSQGADLDKLEKLMALQERWEASEAKKAYVVAMNAFKADPPTIYKTKNVSYIGVSYNHALLEDAAELIGSAMTKHGLSFRWDCEQMEGGLVRVTCIITHILGHSERTALQAGIDLSGKKNNIQALGSTVSYLERYTLFAATGMASKDMGMDDDGKGSEGIKYIDEGQAKIIRTKLALSGSSEGNLLNHFKAESIDKFPLQAYKEAISLIDQRIANKAKKQTESKKEDGAV